MAGSTALAQLALPSPASSNVSNDSGGKQSVSSVSAGLLPDSQSAALNRWLTRLVLAEIPHQFTDDRRWGMQQQVYAGFKFRRDQNRLETERVWKKVNHGKWQKFTLSLRDPERQFSVAIPRVRQSPTGTLVVDIQISTPLNISARQSQWQRGVQVYSLSGEGWAQVGLRLECELGMKIQRQADPEREGQRQLLLQPRIVQAELVLQEFHLDRVSKVGGEVSQQLGRWIEDELRQEIAEKTPDLVARLNSQIERNADKLVIPLEELLAGDWAASLTTPLPAHWKRWIPLGSDGAIDR